MNATVNTKTPFEQWHYTHGGNTQGISWVDKLVKSAWDAALEEAAKCAADYPNYDEAIAEEIRSLK